MVDLAHEASIRNASILIVIKSGFYKVEIIETEGPFGRGTNTNFNEAIRLALNQFDAKARERKTD